MDLDELLELYFDETGEDDTHMFYDPKEGLELDCKFGCVTCIDVAHDRSDCHIHTDLNGQMLSTEDFLLNGMEIYKVTREKLR